MKIEDVVLELVAQVTRVETKVDALHKRLDSLPCKEHDSQIQALRVEVEGSRRVVKTLSAIAVGIAGLVGTVMSLVVKGCDIRW